MSEDPDGISRRENPRAERGGDPGGISPGESQQAEGLVVNAKDDSPSKNQRREAPVVNARAEARARTAGQSDAVKWEELLVRAGCGDRVIAHAKAVTALALTFTKNGLADRDLVRAGAMLHDIGRGTSHGISHAQRGAEIARSIGLDPAVVSIIERHIGAGLSADECSLLGLIPRDCIPVTLEEKIVANADNLVHGSRPASMEDTLGGAIGLPRRIRRRILRLYLEMEAFR